MPLQIYRSDGTPKTTPPGVVPLVTALPAVPYDGQQVDYQNVAMAAQGVRWRFVFNAATGKWEFAGGIELRADVITDETQGTPGSFVELTTTQRLTVPLVGDYIAQVGCYGFAIVVGAQAAIAINPGVVCRCDIHYPSANMRLVNTMEMRLNALAAATVMSMVFYAGSAGTVFGGRRFSLKPVRVG